MDDYIILDLNKTREKFRSNKPTYVRQGEVDSAPLNVQIVLNGEPFDLTGCKVYFEAKRSDGKLFAESASITSAKNGFVAHAVPAGFMLAYGTTELAYFAVHTSDDAIITTETMDITTLPGICMFADSDYIPYIERILVELEGYLERCEVMERETERMQGLVMKALSDVNVAVSDSDNAVALANAATAEASYAASLANTGAKTLRETLDTAIQALSGASVAKGYAETVDILGRNMCSEYVWVNGYVFASESQFSLDKDGYLLIEQVEFSVSGYARLGGSECGAALAEQIADRALNLARDADRRMALNESETARLVEEVAALRSAIWALAAQVGTDAFVVEGYMVAAGISAQSGYLALPTGTYKDGYIQVASS